MGQQKRPFIYEQMDSTKVARGSEGSLTLRWRDQHATILGYCTGQPIPNEPKFWPAPPLFLEDENIFQKSARVVPIILEFHIKPREPIFELHL
jgi:hypothetical protein